MKITTITSKTKISSLAAAIALLGAIQAQGQSVLYTFSDHTSDGWANAGFSTTPAASTSTMGGQSYIYLPLGGFQVGNVATGDPTSALYQAMQAALLNPAGYDLSYNYRVNTATFVGSTYFQLGSYVNTGSGYYAQDFPSGAWELYLNGSQIASGQVFTGTVTVPFTAFGTDASAASETYFRLGLIENGDGTGAGAYFTDISVAPVAVPEPSSMALLGMGAVALLKFARRRIA